MRLMLNVSKESVEKMLHFLDTNSDEGPIDGPHPSSKEYIEFLNALQEAYDENTKSFFGIHHTTYNEEK